MSTNISLFGAQAPPTTPLFGQPAGPMPAPNTGFVPSLSLGQPAGNSLFGAAPAPLGGGGMFGAPGASASPATGGIFGASAAPSGGFFGATSAPANTGFFGPVSAAPAPATSLFSNTGTTSGGLFAGTSSVNPVSSGGSLFGAAGQPGAGIGMGMGGPTSFGGGMPGQMGGQKRGTVGVKFQRVNVDGAYFMHFLPMSNFCGSDMSTEEFRYEDYMLRKAGQVHFPNRPGTAGGIGMGMGAPSGSTIFAPSSSGVGATSGMFAGGSTSLFASQAPATAGGSLFGGPRPAAPAVGMGASTGGLFGAAPTSGGLFGPTSAPAASGGLFGPQPQTQASSLFSPSGSTYGAAAVAPSSGGLFGPTGGASTGLFGQQPAAAQGGSLFSGMGSTNPSMTQQFSGVQALGVQPPYYASGNVQTSVQPVGSSYLSQTLPGPTTQKEATDPYKIRSFFTGEAELRKYYARNVTTEKRDAFQDEGRLLRGSVPGFVSADDRLVRREMPAEMSVPAPNLQTFDRNEREMKEELLRARDRFQKLTISASQPEKHEQINVRAGDRQYDEGTITLKVELHFSSKKFATKVSIHKSHLVEDIKHQALQQIENLFKFEPIGDMALFKSGQLLADGDTIDAAGLQDYDRLVLTERKEAEAEVEPEIRKGSSATGKRKSPRKSTAAAKKYADPKLLPTVTRPGYRTVPNVVQLNRMTEDELHGIKDFEVANEHGKIVFEGTTDVAGLDLDSIVSINSGEVVVYPEGMRKPETGQGLNKPAMVTLYKCFPKKKEEGTEKFERRLQKAAEKQNVCFLSNEHVG